MVPQPKRKLTYQQALLVRNTAHSLKPSVWMELFGISQACVLKIRRGDTYREPEQPPLYSSGPPSLGADNASHIKELLVSGKSLREAGAIVGCSRDTCSRIKRGVSYSEVPWPNGRPGSMLSAYGYEEYMRMNLELIQRFPQFWAHIGTQKGN